MDDHRRLHPGTDFVIRPFEPGDLEQVVDLVGRSLVEWNVIPPSDLPLKDRDLQSLPESYSGKSGFWVAMKDGGVIGTVGIHDRDGVIAKLKRMFVSPDFRGTGVGQTLLEHAFRMARERGFTTMILSTNENMKRAHAFYAKNGFLQYGTEGTQLLYRRDL